jgi:myo-inositol 2-dehydrogenase/D-chiro-inositol 1-dehydrogenase
MERGEQGRMDSDRATLSRREFVKATAALAIAPAAVSVLGGAGRKSGRAPGTLRIGLIGCGGRGTGAAVQALAADPGTVLVAMGDAFADRLNSSYKGITEELKDAAEAKVQVPPEKRFVGLDAYQKVIDSGVDVVLLTTYPQFRPLHLKAAVAAGKHVFAEKPLAVDAPGLRSVLESAAEAKRQNLALQVGFCWRYNAGMRATFEQVHSGAVGEVVSVHTTYHTGTLGKNPRKPEWSDLEFQLRNWWHFTWLSGDHVVEQAIHSIDRMAWALGDRLPARVTCLGGRAARTGPESGNAYDHFAAVYEYEDGSRAFHTCRQIDGCPSDNTDYIYGTKGSCTVNGWAPTYLVKDRAGKEVWSYSGPAIKDMYQVEHDELFASIRAGKPNNDCERGARSTMMALMARMAAYSGQTVSWEQAMNSKESLTPEGLEFGPLPTPVVAVPGKTKFV